MKYTSRISATALLAAAAMITSPDARALGLGDATVESYLKQPLRARIDLVTRESDDLATVSARLASAEDYELIGASLDDISVPVRFSVESEGDQVYLLATSKLPLNAPVVRLLVEVNWSAGRMLREYTLFLDPPTANDVAPPLPRVDFREEPAPVRSAALEQAPEPAAAETMAAPEPEVREKRSTAADAAPPGTEYGPVMSGDTLWNIASDWAEGTGLGVNRVMIAIQRENPDAFIRGNINLLKRGEILRLPTVDEVRNIPGSAAFEEVRSQEEAFRSPVSTPSVSDSSIPLLSEATTPQADESPDLESMALDPAIPGPAAEVEEQAVTVAEDSVEVIEEAVEEPAARDQLELVPPSASEADDSANGFEESEEEGDPSLDVRSLREQLARTEEDLITRQQQNEYLQNRIAELEAELEATQDSTVSDGEMAAMEERLRQERLDAQSEEVEKSFFERFGVWALSLLALAAAVIAWLFSSRMREEEIGDEDETIQDIRDDAEDVLRTLSDDEPKPSEAVKTEDTVDVETVKEVSAEDDGDAEIGIRKAPATDADAEILEEDSSDPEIQLDLARAYISMGDKEAARVILEEVAENGSDEQKSEAQKMLDLM